LVGIARLDKPDIVDAVLYWDAFLRRVAPGDVSIALAELLEL
jgi:hypothetical protein